jgi:putative glycosyltransferase (TIGR04372 family)
MSVNLIKREIEEQTLRLNLNPHSPETRARLSQLLWDLYQQLNASGQENDAFDALQMAVDIDPAPLPSEVLLTFAKYFLQSGAADRAAALVDHVLSRNQLTELTAVAMIELLVALNSPDMALQIRNQLKDPVPAPIYLAMSSILEQNGQIVAALEELTKGCSVFPDNQSLQLAFARLLLTQSRPREAAEVLLALVKLAPDDNSLHNEIQELLCDTGTHKAVFDEWEDILSDQQQLLSKLYDRFTHMAYLNGWHEEVMEAVARGYRARDRHREKLNLGAFNFSIFPPELFDGMGNAANLGAYIKLRILGWDSSHILVLKRYEEMANPALVKCFAERYPQYLSVISDPQAIEGLNASIAKPLSIGYGFERFRDKIYFFDHLMTYADRQWELEGRPNPIDLSAEHEARGWNCLHSLGMKPGDWFVALHMREMPHMRENGEISPREVFDISTYFSAIKEITARGGWVVRMGDPRMTPLPKMDRVVDYVHTSSRSDWMDVFLWARAKYYLGTASGPSVIPRNFGVPSLITNWVSLIFRPTYRHDLFLPKLFWHDREARFFSFREMVSSRLSVAQSNNLLKKMGLRMVDNSAEDLRDAAAEMLDRLEGKAYYTEEDDVLQERFQRLCTSYGGPGDTRIGRDFLRKYAYLLD